MPYHAFISYAHRDDEGEAAITALRSQLELSIGARLGETARIFQDKAGLLVGQMWEERIESALTCPCLIPIVTPAYLKSEHCLDELVRFLDVEGRKQQADRILPLYYIEVGAIERRLGRPWRLVDELSTKQERALDILLQRQMADIRSFRTLPPEDVMRTAEARTVIDKLAVEVAVRAAQVRRAPTLTVTPDGSGLRSVSAAIRLAEPGARILVKGPATYRESLIIDKPLELLAEPTGEHVTILGADGPPVTCTGAPVRIAGFRLTSERFNGAIVSGGYCVMEELEVDGSRHSGILIRDGAEAALVCCCLQHADDCGVHAQHRGTKCTIVSSTIRENGRGGIFYSQEANGVAESNLIERNGGYGIYITAGANPRIRRNRIRDNQRSGVLVYLHGEWASYGPGRGLVEDNDVTGGRQFGIEIMDGADPCIRGNRISSNLWGGIRTRSGGRGTIYGNEIHGNGGSAIKNESGQPRIGRNVLSGNAGAEVEDHGGATFDDP